MTGVAEAVAAAQRHLDGIYRLDLALRAEAFVMEAEAARELLTAPAPRSGVVVVEEEGELQLGLYVDPRDAADPGTILEETSHLLCLAWHATQGRPVSQLVLELQGEVDRFAVARLAGRDGFDHFHGFRWDDWVGEGHRERYETAHRVALRYCRELDRRYPRRSDTPALLAELRRFYRAAPQAKLRS